jgi:hypothetical protein
MTTETTSATPAQTVETPAEQVQQVEAASTETASTEATAAQTQVEPVETPEEKAKKEPWFQKRIGELTREKYGYRGEAEHARAEAQQLREQLARVQAGEQTPQNAGQVPQTLVQQEAQRLIAERSFNESCNKVYATGKSEFPDFDAAVSNLQMVGVPREFLEFTAASDAGAKLIHHLGKDLDEAARIATLPPVLMARELAKLEIKLSQVAAKPVSKAPAPITPIGSGPVGAKDLADPNLSDAEFAKLRKAQIAQRHSR